MGNLESKLMKILEESNLINLFDKAYIKEETNIKGEFVYKYFVNMKDNINNPLHVSSFEFYTRRHSYKDGSFSKFRIYHDNKMPKEVHNQLKELDFVISNCKDYIDFASDNIDNLISVAKEIHSILDKLICKGDSLIGYNLNEKHLEMAKVLVEEIKYKNSIFYDDLRIRAGIPKQYMKLMWSYLGHLSTFCFENDMPLISAMVISKDRGIPGDNFYKEIYCPFRNKKANNKEKKMELFLEEWKLIKEYKGWDRLIELLENEINLVTTIKRLDVKKPKRLNTIKTDEVEYIEIDEFNIEFDEGEYIDKILKTKKRNTKARELKLKQFEKQNGSIFCEVCKENDIVVLDIHHDLVQVSDMEEGHKTKLSDLRVLCSNCHRKVHYYKKDVEYLIKEK